MAIVLMIVDKHYAALGQVRGALSLVVAPLQYAVSWPMSLVDHVGELMTARDTLIKENLNLKAEHLILKAQVQRLIALESENNQLKTLLRSGAEIQGKMQIAQLLAVDIDPFIHQILIDKGTRDNVYIGQPVLDAYGVMGQIIQTGPITSRVLLINDPKSGVPVRNTRNGVRAIAIGDGYTGQLYLMNVSQTTDIRQDDVFVTSGMGQNYPEGYPVGRVISVAHDPSHAFSMIKLEPSAHLNQGRQVLLVWPNEREKHA